MKAPEQRPAQGELPLPSPRSPDDLDQRILDYARNNTPRSRSLMRPAWMAGAATACVLVVALLVGGPQQQAPQERMESQARKAEAMGSAHPPAVPAAADAAPPERDMPAALEESVDMASNPEPAREPSWLAARIREIALLAERGDRPAAQEAYRELQQQCQGCQLPETLEEALAAYPNP